MSGRGLFVATCVEAAMVVGCCCLHSAVTAVSASCVLSSGHRGSLCYHMIMGMLMFMFICGNKMPTRCNRGFYCRSYCLLNMFRAPLSPSLGAQEYYTVVAACGISCCGFQVAGLVWS